MSQAPTPRHEEPEYGLRCPATGSGCSVPSGFSSRIRPGRSVINAEPSGSQSIDHG